MSPAIKNADPRAWLQELKTSRKLQVALASLPLLVWFLWPDAPRTGPARSAAQAATAPLGDHQTSEIKKLPDLAKLNKAGELPGDDHMYRDLFLFEGPPPPPPPPLPPPPPPPPPTPEQVAAELLKRTRDQESASRPQDLRYLGYMGTKASGRLGAFMRGEDPVSIKQGDLVNPKWRLTKLTDTSAEFQNLKFPDLKHRLETVDPQSGRANAPANEF
jgi:type IV secretory pathway VirB10-like protein